MALLLAKWARRMLSGLSRSVGAESGRGFRFVANVWRKFDSGPSGDWLDAVNVDCVLFHPQLADDSYLFADIRLGLAGIVQLVIEFCDRIVEHQVPFCSTTRPVKASASCV